MEVASMLNILRVYLAIIFDINLVNTNNNNAETKLRGDKRCELLCNFAQ